MVTYAKSAKLCGSGVVLGVSQSAVFGSVSQLLLNGRRSSLQLIGKICEIVVLFSR